MMTRASLVETRGSSSSESSYKTHSNDPDKSVIEEVKLKDNGGIKSGTLTLLVDYLIDINMDPVIVEVFLAAFPAFAPASEIWSIVEKKYKHYRGASEARKKVLNFLWEWIRENLHRDFLSRGKKRGSCILLYDELIRFVGQLDDRDTINRWKLHILKSAAARGTRRDRKVKLRTSDVADLNNLSLSNSGNTSTLNTLSPRRPPPNVLSGGLSTPPKRITMTLSTSAYAPASQQSTGTMLSEPSMSNIFGAVASEKVYEMGKVVFLDIDPADAAKQLTLLESDIFQKIAHTEFHHLNWKKEDGKKIAPHILALVERFNQVSYWVSTEIVMQSELRERVNAIRKFVVIAEHLRDLGNYNGVMEIIGGLNSFVVTRLQATWAQTPQRFVASFEDLNRLMENKSNYRDYRTHMRDRKGPVVPYLGVILRDILFIEEGNKNFIGDPKDQVFNFEKIQLLGEVLTNVRRQQETGYAFDTIPALQNFFKTLVSLPEENLYKQSLMCEANAMSASGSTPSSVSEYNSSMPSESQGTQGSPVM